MSVIITLAASPGVAAPSDFGDLLRGADPIFQQLPNQGGGPNSDTSYLNNFGQERWQHLADDFSFDNDVTIRHLRWWGFYDQDNPPAEEIFRVRIYRQRPDIALPDETQIEFETLLDTPSRLATGQTVFVGVDPDEYVYDSVLMSPVDLQANIPYWLSVVQVGDLSTAFRWETSTTINGHAFANPVFPNWQPAASGELAFELSSVPEPSTALIVGCSIPILLIGRRRGAAMR